MAPTTTIKVSNESPNQSLGEILQNSLPPPPAHRWPGRRRLPVPRLRRRARFARPAGDRIQHAAADRLHRRPHLHRRHRGRARGLRRRGAVRLGRSHLGRPGFKPDASNSAAEQEKQAGMHHDGIHFFPLDDCSRRKRTRRGLLVMNHEYTDDGLLHVGGMVPWTADKVRKSQAAHGVSVIEVEFDGGKWKRRAPLALRPPDHRLHAHRRLRPGRRRSADAHRRRSHRPQGAGHAEQLRPRRHPLGHLPRLRGELERVLRQRRRHRARRRARRRGRPRAGRSEALRPDGSRRRLPLARARRPLRRRRPLQRTAPLRLGGRDRPEGPPSRRRSSAPRSGAASTRAPARSRPGTAGWSSTWATTSASNTSTSSSARCPGATTWTAARARWTTASCTSPS